MPIIKKILFSTFFLLLSSFEGKSQDNVNSFYNSQISKNIIFYHLRYSKDYELNIKPNGILPNSRNFVANLWSLADSDLEFEIFKSSLTYPKSGMVLFEINKVGFAIRNVSSTIYYSFRSFNADNKYLVLIDTVSNQILYISGNFFKSSISSHFRLDISHPESFYEYIKLRTFNWSTSDFSFNRLDKDKLVFNAFSNLMKKSILVEVARNNFDNVSVNEVQLAKVSRFASRYP